MTLFVCFCDSICSTLPAVFMGVNFCDWDSVGLSDVVSFNSLPGLPRVALSSLCAGSLVVQEGEVCIPTPPSCQGVPCSDNF